MFVLVGMSNRAWVARFFRIFIVTDQFCFECEHCFYEYIIIALMFSFFFKTYVWFCTFEYVKFWFWIFRFVRQLAGGGVRAITCQWSASRGCFAHETGAGFGLRFKRGNVVLCVCRGRLFDFLARSVMFNLITHGKVFKTYILCKKTCFSCVKKPCVFCI